MREQPNCVYCYDDGLPCGACEKKTGSYRETEGDDE